MLATQIENEVLGKVSESIPQPQTSHSTSSTSNEVQSNMSAQQEIEEDVRTKLLHYKILQNKCLALERQVIIMRGRQEAPKSQDDNQKKEIIRLSGMLKSAEIEIVHLKRKQKELQGSLDQMERKNKMLMEKVCVLEQANPGSDAADKDISEDEVNQINMISELKAEIIKQVTNPAHLKMVFSIPPTNASLDEEINKSRILLQTFLNTPQASKNTIEGCWATFSELIPIVSQLCKVIKAEEKGKPRYHFTRSEFVPKQAKILQEEINFNDDELPKNFYQKRLANESEFTDGLKSFMEGAPRPLTAKETNKRILFEILATFAANSAIMSQLFVEGDTLDAKEAKGNATTVIPSETILDMIANTTTECIVPIHGLKAYWGLTDGMAAFALAISRHYSKFENHSNVDNILARYFNSLIMISLNNASLLIKLTEFIINIAQVTDCNRLFSKLCKNSDSVECSHIHQMIKIPYAGCELQVLFMLLVNAFPFSKKVPEHRINDLFKLSENLNAIAYHFFTNGKNMECIENVKDFEINSCKCLYGLILATTSINKKVLEQRFRHNQRYSQQIKNSILSYMQSAVIFLRYTRNRPPFWDMKNVHLELNQLYLMVKDGELNFKF